MTARPSAAELIDAVSNWIDGLRVELNPRADFLARVAVNALGIARREVELGPESEQRSIERLRALLETEGDCAELTSELCRRLRNGSMDVGTPGLLALLKANTADQLAIDQPRYVSSS